MRQGMVAALVTVFVALAGVGSPTLAEEPYNVLVIVADDVGVDQVQCYQQHFDPDPSYRPCTPNLDQLAQGGVRFTNAWASPLCSPTRAQIMSGRPALQTGVGNVIGTANLDPPLAVLPTLTPYAAAVGKWHLADLDSWASHPLDAGFGFPELQLPLTGFWGTENNAVPRYDDWTRWNGAGSESMGTYATTQTTDDALAYLDAFSNLGTEPWLLYVSYNAAHAPFHCPQDYGGYCPFTNCQINWCNACDEASSTDAEKSRAMVQAMDKQIGRLLAALPSNTAVIFIGDNGTPGPASVDPFPSNHAKASMYQGGVNVPLIIRAPGGETGVQHELVCATDILATAADFLGTSPPGEFSESISMASYVTDGQSPVGGPRGIVFAELFKPPYTPIDGAPPSDYVAKTHKRTVRDDRFKLIEIRKLSQFTQEFYCLYSEAALAGGTPTPHDPAILDDDGDPVSSAFEGVDLLQEPISTWPAGACDALYNLRRKLVYEYPPLPVKDQVSISPTIVRTASHVDGGSPVTSCSERVIRVSYLPNPPVNLIDRAFLEFDLSGIPDNAEITRVELEVDVIRVASGAYTSVAVWPITDDVSDYDIGADCDNLFSSLNGGAYAAASNWAPNCRFIKTFTLSTAAEQDIEGQLEGDDLFSVALRFQHEDPLFEDSVDLADVYGLHRLRVFYRAATGGGDAGLREAADAPEVTAATRLQRARPNPFNPTTTIRYSIGEHTHVGLNVYNLAGQLVRTLVDGAQAPRFYSAVWDGRDDAGKVVPSGIYFYRLVAGDFSQTRKMVLLK